jgi:uncharacterized protein DUF4037/nucleotidyltransferase-like protein
MPAEKLRTLNVIVDRVRSVPNVVAVVLGGSYAGGLARSDSDIDIGLYYRDASPFPIDRLRSIAESVCLPGSIPTVTGFYEWGPWVNGGAWIQTPTGKVDFLYRSLEHVRTVIEEGCSGVWRHDFDQQPPYGFRSVVYLGETCICVPLYDPDGEIARLKQSIANYPEALRSRIVQECLWAVEFSLHFCRGFADVADVYSAAGCMTRIAQYLVQALFALNNEYFVSDKYANRLIDQFPSRPRDFTSRLAGVLASPGADTSGLTRSADILTSLWLETVGLTSGTYQPRFRLPQSLPAH